MGDTPPRSAFLLKASVLVLGRTGMLGQACVDRLASIPGCTVMGTQRQDPAGADYLDVSASSAGLEEILHSRRWDYVVNAVGILRPMIDPQDPDSVQRAIRVNAVLPCELASIAERTDTRVIHVSTDAVFGERSGGHFDESSPICPGDLYGCTKVLGECRSRNVINLRCSIVGRDPHHKRGLVERVYGLPAGGELKGFTDYVWSAATTIQVADICAAIISANAFDRLRRLSHIFHFAPNPPISKCDFLKTVSDVAGKDIAVIPTLSPGGSVRRILTSRFEDFAALGPASRSWTNVLNEALSVPSESSR